VKSWQLDSLHPEPEEAVGNEVRAVLPIDHIAFEQAIDGALCVGRRAEPGTLHKFPGERLDGRSFAGEAFEELALIDGERFPQG